MTDNIDERDWFCEGAIKGWLKYYSLCSAHGEELDEDCPRCMTGTWGVARHNGRFAGPDGEATDIMHTDQLP